MEVRRHYVLICELLEIVDHDLRYLILLSNLNNLYFICFQLLNIYEYVYIFNNLNSSNKTILIFCSTLPFLINYVYFWYSLVYLFGRTIIAQFIAANIYDSSLKPLKLFQSIPCEGFCIEVH